MANESRLIKADSLMERFRIVAQSGGPVVVHVSDICAAIEDEVYETTEDAVEVVRCQNCGWWHRHKLGDLSRGVCDKYAASKSENGYCDEPLLEEREYPWKN